MRPRAFSEQDIHLALDGELPADESADFKVWLDQNPDMKALYARYGDDRERLRAALTDDGPLPTRLTAVVTREPKPPRSETATWKFAAIAASLFAVGGLAGYLAAAVPQPPSSAAVANNPLVGEAIAAHLVYSNEKRHAVEVPADQADHLNSWLSNRVGVKLAAPDLAAEGFELVGGRLLPSGERNAAQFMYQDPAGERISLYIVREDQPVAGGYKVTEARGARALFWQDGGYGCVITGKLPEAQLTGIANSAYDQLEKVAAQ